MRDNRTLVNLVSQRDKLRMELEEFEKINYENKKQSDTMFGLLRAADIRRSQFYHSSPQYRERSEKHIHIVSTIKSFEASIAALNRAIDRHLYSMNLQTESADVSVAHTGAVRDSNVETHVTLTDVGGETKDDTYIHQNSNHLLKNDDLGMKDFLERPVQVAAISLSLDSDIDLSFNIWNLFLGDPTVRSKLRNYAFLRCNLGVRITLSGTPFHYGRMLVSYQPFPYVNQTLSSFGPTYRIQRLNYLSQAPGAKTLDVRENAPFEMVVPYVSPQPVGRLFNNSAVALSDAANFDDFDKLGTLYISTLNQIKAVTTTATNVYLYVYVYATDVTILGATGSVGVIETESDERIKGPVETMSTAMLPVSKAMEHIPVIGRFAKASSTVLGVLSKVSALFGWSYPTVITHPGRVKNEPFQNGAQTIGMDTGHRITLDPKQELTVDPRIVGVDDDEMAIAGICQRESLLDQFSWNVGEVPLTDIIWSAAVTPRANIVDNLTTKLGCMPTALSFAATPFKYWRGKITYRFEIVASNFHRGKLMFCYEPNIVQYSLITANLNTNKQYVKVIDIQETQSVEFTIDWNFPKPWCKNIDDASMDNTVGVQFVPGSSLFETCNGVIFVTPFTEIQSPDGSAVEINVFVHAPQMVFNRFSEELLPLTTLPYSGTIVLESDERDFNRGVSNMEMNKSIHDHTMLSEEFFGELPVSFRSLLKRFMQSYERSTGATSGVASFIFPILPSSYEGVTFNTRPIKNLYQYIRFAYLAQRGGMRKRFRFVPDGSDLRFQGARINVSLNEESTTTLGPTTSGTKAISEIIPDGTVTFMNLTNTGIEFELPFYTNNLFAWACNDNPWATGVVPMEQSLTRDYRVDVESLTTTNVIGIETFATAEDFALMRWLGAVPFEVQGSPA